MTRASSNFCRCLNSKNCEKRKKKEINKKRKIIGIEAERKK